MLLRDIAQFLDEWCADALDRSSSVQGAITGGSLRNRLLRVVMDSEDENSNLSLMSEVEVEFEDTRRLSSCPRCQLVEPLGGGQGDHFWL